MPVELIVTLPDELVSSPNIFDDLVFPSKDLHSEAAAYLIIAAFRNGHNGTLSGAKSERKERSKLPPEKVAKLKPIPSDAELTAEYCRKLREGDFPKPRGSMSDLDKKVLEVLKEAARETKGAVKVSAVEELWRDEGSREASDFLAKEVGKDPDAIWQAVEAEAKRRLPKKTFSLMDAAPDAAA